MYFVVWHLLILVVLELIVKYDKYSIVQKVQDMKLLKKVLYIVLVVVHLNNHHYHQLYLDYKLVDFYYYHLYLFVYNLNKLFHDLQLVLLWLLVVYRNHILIDRYMHLHHNVVVDQLNYHEILMVEHLSYY